ncbi:MAG: HNH endonuclease signature motif containing protein [Candidatus Gracilibacteria bacterium]|jgi:hypothetical protein
MKKQTIKERFLNKVKIGKPDECWLWIGGVSSRGYGNFCPTHRKNIRAHRFSYELFKGKIPEGLLVCHKCDVPRCVNPDHLFVGTQSENILDCSQKGRLNKPDNRGEKCVRSKLNWGEVSEIRSMYLTKNFTQKKLGEIFGVCDRNISDIVKGVTWKVL